MRTSMKLSAAERRAGVDLRDVRARKRPKKKASKKPATAAEFRPIAFVETTLHDPIRDRWDAGCDEGGVRLYCTSRPATHGEDNGRWALQVRARVKLRSGKDVGKHFAVGTASMSREDLRWLRDLIDGALEDA